MSTSLIKEYTFPSDPSRHVLPPLRARALIVVAVPELLFHIQNGRDTTECRTMRRQNPYRTPLRQRQLRTGRLLNRPHNPAPSTRDF